MATPNIVHVSPDCKAVELAGYLSTRPETERLVFVDAENRFLDLVGYGDTKEQAKHGFIKAWLAGENQSTFEKWGLEAPPQQSTTYLVYNVDVAGAPGLAKRFSDLL